jgi:hypothetical protein
VSPPWQKKYSKLSTDPYWWRIAHASRVVSWVYGPNVSSREKAERGCAGLKRRMLVAATVQEMMQRCQPASFVSAFAWRNIRACRVCGYMVRAVPKITLSRFSETIRAHGADCHSHVTRCSRLSGSSSSSLRTVGPISNEATSDLSWNGLGRFRDRVSGPERRRIVRAGNYSSLTAAQSSPLGDYRRVIADEGQALRRVADVTSAILAYDLSAMTAKRVRWETSAFIHSE